MSDNTQAYTLQLQCWNDEQIERLGHVLSDYAEVLAELIPNQYSLDANPFPEQNVVELPPEQGWSLANLTQVEVSELKVLASSENIERHIYRGGHLLRIESQSIYFKLYTLNPDGRRLVDQGYL